MFLHLQSGNNIFVTIKQELQWFILGEVRGDEARTLLDSFNTGHAGSMATIHKHPSQFVDSLKAVHRSLLRASKPYREDAMSDDQAKATGGANRPPPNDPLARSVSKKNTIMSFGSIPASPSFSTKAATRLFFLLASVPEDISTSIINIWSVRGFGSAG
jgi:hypothetical protein